MLHPHRRSQEGLQPGTGSVWRGKDSDVLATGQGECTQITGRNHELRRGWMTLTARDTWPLNEGGGTFSSLALNTWASISKSGRLP